MRECQVHQSRGWCNPRSWNRLSRNCIHLGEAQEGRECPELETQGERAVKRPWLLTSPQACGQKREAGKLKRDSQFSSSWTHVKVSPCFKLLVCFERKLDWQSPSQWNASWLTPFSWLLLGFSHLCFLITATMYVDLQLFSNREVRMYVCCVSFNVKHGWTYM